MARQTKKRPSYKLSDQEAGNKECQTVISALIGRRVE